MDPRYDGLKYKQDSGVLLQCNEENKRRTRNNIKEGSYGVSIRVQGIDGHPFIVLNNKEGYSSRNIPPPETEHLSQDRSLPNLKNSQNSLRTDDKDFPENPYKSYKSSNKSNYLRSGTVASECEDESLKTSLLNFQRHPELLKPYDPNENSLNKNNYKSSKNNSGVSTIEEQSKKDSKRYMSLPKEATFKNVRSKSTDTVELNGKEASSKKEDQIKSPTDTSILSSTSDNNTSESFSSSNGSPCSTNSTITAESRRTRPDVLQFKRQDSGQPLEGPRSRRSSCSSATATSSQSLQKFWLEEQEDALYADNVNRHENRRYIPFVPGTGRDIDTGCIPGVDELIEKFDATIPVQRRGRSAKRNRINPEERKRARSVDSALPFGLQGNTDYLNEFSRNLGKSNEHLLRPSQICQQKPHMQNYKLPFKRQNTTGSLISQASPPDNAHQQSYSYLPYCKETKNSMLTPFSETDSATLPRQNKRNGDVKTMKSSLKLLHYNTGPSEEAKRSVSAKTHSSGQGAQVTPDLLKGQQQLAQQTHEENAKQILFNYLKEGSQDNDDATKRKVNLVFEKIQTLKSRASSNVQSPDPAAEIKVLTDQKGELEKKLVVLQKQLNEQTKSQESNKEQNNKTKASMKDIQEQLERSMEENLVLRGKLGESEKELRKHLEDLFELKMEQEQYQTEIRDLQEQLSEMHDELDDAKHSVDDDGEKEALIEDLMHMKQAVQELLIAKEEQEDLLRKRERELTALKGALKEEVSTHDQEIDKLKEQYEKELRKMRESLQETMENVNNIATQKNEANEIKNACESRVKSLLRENEELRQRIQQLEAKITELHQKINELNEDNDRTKERLRRTEKEKQQLSELLEDAKEQEKEALQFSRGLENQLEDTKRNLSRITHEHHQLNERLKEESNQKEQLRNLKNEMENERWQLDKTIEKLHKEISQHVEFSRTSTVEVQKQFDDYKEKNRKEGSEMQRQIKDKSLELERCYQTIKKLQDEIRHLEENLQDHQSAHDESLTKHHLLQQTIKDLQYELDAKNHLKDDRTRQIKSMEDKIFQLEIELDEEKNNSDLLLERITRCREQIEQMRGELLQERAAKQDLECDKMSLERQNKDLKSRIAHLETSHRSNKEGLVAQMETRIVELEERLENEERDRASLQLSNRRLERKVKELMMQVDDEHLTLTDQKDQLSLRLKSMKRQVEEAEEEIDRLESSKKKLQRDLEEQVDLNEQLQGQLNGAKKELSRRRNSPSKMLNDLDDDDDLSTDGESLYEAPSLYKYSRDDGLTT
ncbi:PREDICTED: cingulin-like protein 1 isoform X1 [Nanorana parkeri]|uniref:cingulin-like protein 1 isoform X1 n=1 Tax=Nanorana parkeri TaxID=125878 RepID=UPI000854BC23|nr:PREDICTED: cingulin-like protein 1 isoform X1 [Nanorana parkeri]XP_018415431.1 PREDICTED: cingulin-like protein 1 isoform X1 [Nanorana parkeri]